MTLNPGVHYFGALSVQIFPFSLSRMLLWWLPSRLRLLLLALAYVRLLSIVTRIDLAAEGRKL